jgi:protein CpxP
MNQLSRNKILVSIIAILLITNLVMLITFFRVCKPNPAETKKPGFTEKLKNDVGFTPEQIAVFEPKKKVFWKRMRERFDEIKKTKETFYHQMYDPAIPDSTLESYADVIGKQQKELDLQVIRHFRDIRKMCTPEQLPKFDSLLPPIIERMTARPDKK